MQILSSLNKAMKCATDLKEEVNKWVNCSYLDADICIPLALILQVKWPHMTSNQQKDYITIEVMWNEFRILSQTRQQVTINCYPTVHILISHLNSAVTLHNHILLFSYLKYIIISIISIVMMKLNCITGKGEVGTLSGFGHFLGT